MAKKYEERETQWRTEIGERLKAIRSDRGMGLKDLSALSGLSITAISMTERGVIAPNAITILKLCKALEIPSTAILGV